MIKLDDVDTQRPEYSRKCGWIDWEHATPGRRDLEAIWSHLPLDELSGSAATKAECSRRDLSLLTIDGWSYYQVDFPLESDKWTRFWNSSPPAFYVRWKGDEGSLYYQRAAITVYQYGCNLAETYQGDSRLTRGSSFSLEDLVSNLIAFYMHTEGLDQDDVRDKAGGWTDPGRARNHSLALYKKMVDGRVAQPDTNPERWYQAYLYNDLLSAYNALFRTDAAPPDEHRGWKPLPAYFRRVKPLACSLPGLPGDDILFGWLPLSRQRDHPYLFGWIPSSSRIHPSREPIGFLARQQPQARPTGPGRGLGRSPGPLGIA
jgi:hypothetical protein